MNTTGVVDALAAADAAEFAAYADAWAAASPQATSALGLFSARLGPYTVLGCRAASGVPMLNRIVGAGLSPLDEAALAAAVALLHGNGCICQVALREDAPGAAETARWLTARGFKEGYAWMRFIRPGVAPPPAPAGAPRVRVCGPGEAVAFGTAFAEGYELPGPFAGVASGLVGRAGWICVLAETPRGDPMGTGAMRMADGVAWLGMGATIPGLRRRGAQSALLAARIAEAARAGCGLLATETGERLPGQPDVSYRNILRAGFTEVGLRRNLVAAPPERPFGG
jgi:GNAT superfamily N-acetyltransferase